MAHVVDELADALVDRLRAHRTSAEYSGRRAGGTSLARSGDPLLGPPARARRARVPITLDRLGASQTRAEYSLTRR